MFKKTLTVVAGCSLARFVAGRGLVVFRCSVYDLVLPYQQKKLRSNAYAVIYFMAFCISWQHKRCSSVFFVGKVKPNHKQNI